ncbi:MAG: hypothetical protein RLZZ628_2654 [Bacteroidota bacterium]|jgi:hypothetical protein
MYNKFFVKNLQIQEGAETLHSEGLLNDEQLQMTQNEFPSHFYHANIFVKIGLFLFTILVLIFVQGLFFMFVAELLFRSQDHIWGSFQFIISIIMFFMIENAAFFQNRKFYRSGTDNALIYAACLSLICSLIMIFKLSNDSLIAVSMAGCITGIAARRYGDMFLSVVTCLLLNSLLFLILIKFPFGKAILPFATMLYWAIVGYLSRNLKQKEDYYYWHDAADVMETVALLGFYAGGNYWVVRECSASLEHKYPSVQIPFAALFYLFMVLIPILYFYAAHRFKERKFLIISLLCIVFSIITYRTYHAVAPLEIALTISGALLIGLSIFLIQKLKTPQYGFSDEPSAAKNSLLETLITSQILKNHNTIEPTGVPFGGGDTGGGGASNAF